MKRLLTLFVFLILSFPALADNATYFWGDAFLQNTGGIVVPNQSISGVCSYWYQATERTTSTIIQSVGPTDTALEIEHIKAGRNMYLRLSLFGQNPKQDHFRAISQESLQYDGRWHHVALTWDVSRPLGANLFAALHTFDGDIQPWDPSRSQGSSQIFTVPYHPAGQSGNIWLIGARIARVTPTRLPGPSNKSNQVGNHYTGALDQVYCHLDSADYRNITDLSKMTMGFAGKVVEFPMGTTAFGPLRLGPDCEAVFGTYDAVLPAICLRGEPPEFAYNYGGATAFEIVGNVTMSGAGPFSLWR